MVKSMKKSNEYSENFSLTPPDASMSHYVTQCFTMLYTSLSQWTVIGEDGAGTVFAPRLAEKDVNFELVLVIILSLQMVGELAQDQHIVHEHVPSNNVLSQVSHL